MNWISTSPYYTRTDYAELLKTPSDPNFSISDVLPTKTALQRLRAFIGQVRSLSSDLVERIERDVQDAQPGLAAGGFRATKCTSREIANFSQRKLADTGIKVLSGVTIKNIEGYTGAPDVSIFLVRYFDRQLGLVVHPNSRENTVVKVAEELQRVIDNELGLSHEAHTQMSGAVFSYARSQRRKLSTAAGALGLVILGGASYYWQRESERLSKASKAFITGLVVNHNRDVKIRLEVNEERDQEVRAYQRQVRDLFWQAFATGSESSELELCQGLAALSPSGDGGSNQTAAMHNYRRLESMLKIAILTKEDRWSDKDVARFLAVVQPSDYHILFDELRASINDPEHAKLLIDLLVHLAKQETKANPQRPFPPKWRLQGDPSQFDNNWPKPGALGVVECGSPTDFFEMVIDDLKTMSPNPAVEGLLDHALEAVSQAGKNIALPKSP